MAAVRKIKLCIGFPHHGQVESGFALSLLSLHSYMQLHPKVDDGIELESIVVKAVKGSILPKQRGMIVNDAIALGCTHLLFIDTDMTFHPELGHDLLKARKEVIACNAATKTTPSYPTARGYLPDDPYGQPIYSTLQKPKVEQIWRIGTGVMMIDLEALIAAKVKQPWFMMTFDTQKQEHEGEDWYFCRILKAYGINVYLHHHASMHIGHLGTLEFTLALTNANREILKRKGTDNGQ